MQLKEVESGKNLEEIKENSFDTKEFKRVKFGGVKFSLIELLIEFKELYVKSVIKKSF